MGASTVLLISRGTMSGGQMIGGCLAEQEGIRYLTREDLLTAVNRYGDLATRVTARIANAVDAYEQFTELRRPFQILMKRALLEYARAGPLAGRSPRIAHRANHARARARRPSAEL